jgi:hypothetical protein
VSLTRSSGRYPNARFKESGKREGMTVPEYVNNLVKKSMEASELKHVELKIRVPKPSLTSLKSSAISRDTTSTSSGMIRS